MSIHSIRLQGPWDVIPPGAPAHQLAEIQQVRIPARWRQLFGDAAGQAIFCRRFNTPTGLTATDQVYCRVPPQAGTIEELQLNGHVLTSDSADPLFFNLTPYLTTFNRLRLAIYFNPSKSRAEPGGLWCPVTLEIHSGESSSTDGKDAEPELHP